VSIAGFYLPPKKTSKEMSDAETSLEESFKKIDIKEEEEGEKDPNNNKVSESEKNVNTDEIDEEKANEANNEEDDSEDEDEVGWITPSNLEEVKKMNLNELEEDISHLNVKVACMTSDFAMQVGESEKIQFF
jgi:RNA-binding protein NOB1